MAEIYKYTPEEAQHEGLSYNPIATIWETAHALSRLSQTKKPEIERMQELVKHSQEHIFEHGHEKKKLYFALSEFGDKTYKHKDPSEFTGFKLVDGKWGLMFENNEEEIYPVEKLVSSEQIQAFRVEGIQD